MLKPANTLYPKSISNFKLNRFAEEKNGKQALMYRMAHRISTKCEIFAIKTANLEYAKRHVQKLP